VSSSRREQRWTVKVGPEETTALFEPAAESSGALFVCAHGAGGHLSDGGMDLVAGALRGIGLDLVRFNFLYREKGGRRPDPMPRLQECFLAVIERALLESDPTLLLLGGRSMGGRAASMLAADGTACDGLVLLAYPLHPAGQPEKLRDAHLDRITVPVLCFNGTRDSLCRQDLMEGVLRRLGPTWNMHWLEAADHGFHVPKSSGRSDPDVLTEIAEVSRSWLSMIPHRRRGGGPRERTRS